MLQVFAEVAGNCMRRTDLFGRLGGEEFAALLVDAPRDRALTVANKIRRSFADATREVDGRLATATVSIGVVITYDAVLDVSALLAQADHALYRAKDNGRNRVESLDRTHSRPRQPRRRRRDRHPAGRPLGGLTNHFHDRSMGACPLRHVRR
ncbi:MAG: GGDEF domain-containing protein [Xanthobacteraceae bacterium]